MKGVVTVLAIPAEKVLVRLSSRHTAHGRPRPCAPRSPARASKALLQAASSGARAFKTIARAPLSSQGTASFALGAGTPQAGTPHGGGQASGRRGSRVVVPAAYGQPRLVSRTLSAPS